MTDTSAPAHRIRPLDGKVALVAGATRGAGRGTAVALGLRPGRVAIRSLSTLPALSGRTRQQGPR
jgi:NAD(P)-dependent dehydrogenase (short-subunit alcohol dehydrogenase family)